MPKSASSWGIAIACAAAASAAGCGVEVDVAVDEPIQVEGATFKVGALAAPPATVSDAKLQVTAVELATGIVGPGERRALAGRSGDSAHALAVQLVDHGTGYWMLPVAGLDPQFPGERSWTAQLAMGQGVAAGLQKLRLAVLDGTGAAGPSRDVQICVPPPWPDNLNACDPTLEPPAAILALEFDRPADVDVEVRRPNGTWVGGKGLGASGKATPEVYLDRDAGAGCHLDSRLREHLVWSQPLASGTWGLHVRLHSACGEQAVRWQLRLLSKQPGAAPKTWQLVELGKWQGQLLAGQADGGKGAALRVGELQVD